jgi:hypothetical protein
VANVISSVGAMEILDSRGNPTLRVTVGLDDRIRAWASVPSGASTGANEASELRDGDAGPYGGKGVLKAAGQVNLVIGPQIHGLDPAQRVIPIHLQASGQCLPAPETDQAALNEEAPDPDGIVHGDAALAHRRERIGDQAGISPAKPLHFIRKRARKRLLVSHLAQVPSDPGTGGRLGQIADFEPLEPPVIQVVARGDRSHGKEQREMPLQELQKMLHPVSQPGEMIQHQARLAGSA